jgi:hypothetical protein
MAYYESINLVKGDDLPALEIILRDSNKAATGTTLDVGDPNTWFPLDLTNVSAVKMKYRRVDTTTVLATIVFTRIQPYVSGKIIMDWGSTTLDDGIGDYEGEIEVEYSNGKFLTVVDNFKFVIKDQF